MTVQYDAGTHPGPSRWENKGGTFITAGTRSEEPALGSARKLPHLAQFLVAISAAAAAVDLTCLRLASIPRN